MTSPQPNYFTCTLGTASQWREKHSCFKFCTINDLIDHLGAANRDEPAVAFAGITPDCPTIFEKSYSYQYTFGDLRDFSREAASRLQHNLQLSCREGSPHRPAALLSLSSPAFLFTWLGLIRLGVPVLLLAPQLGDEAIEHLCETTGAQVIFCDDQNLAKARRLGNTRRIVELSDHYSRPQPSDDFTNPLTITTQSSDIAFLSHTSGTSSGLPKAIVHTHHAAVGVLPCLHPIPAPATFSTTPLYHAGIADILRAWAGSSMTWLFPEGQLPFSATNIMNCIEFADSAGRRPVSYFSSVPFILQLLAEDEISLHRLKRMDLVGVGGAALPSAIGDALVKHGIRLVSRYGNAECGFLMSSERDYSNDKEWQFLRNTNPVGYLSFAQREDGLSELIVQPVWPRLLKTNQDDGSFATADLFEPHPTLSGAWKYHSRADSQIVLASGKKFDPSPTEAAIVDSTKLLRDVLIVGTGKAFPAALLFPRPCAGTPRSDIIEQVWPHIQVINKNVLRHARISKFMLVIVDVRDDRGPLEKSSKGTVLRGKAEKRYKNEIESAYRLKTTGLARFTNTISDHEVAETVQTVFEMALGRSIDPDQSIFHQGVDSIACIQICRMLELTNILDGMTLPLAIVYDHETVNGLVSYIQGPRHGPRASDQSLDDAELVSMRQYSRDPIILPLIRCREDIMETKPRAVVLLTGATGLLGAHLLHNLRHDNTVHKIYCLVRASSPLKAHERLSKALVSRGLPDLGTYGNLQDANKIIPLPSDLTMKHLDISALDYQQISETVTLILHAAWMVNFSLRLRAFDDHLQATHNLLRLSYISKSRFLFLSSTAAVSCSASENIEERPSISPTDASPLGYSRSKWVAESICKSWQQKIDDMIDRGNKIKTNSKNPSVAVIRVGQLCGNEHGIWNAKEAFPLILGTAELTGSLPDLPDEVLNWLPVDVAAKTITEISKAKWDATKDGIAVYHVVNSACEPSWTQMLEWIQEYQGAEHTHQRFNIIAAAEWVEQLEIALNNCEITYAQPAAALLPFWKQTYLRRAEKKGDDGTRVGSVRFSTRCSTATAPTMRMLQPVNKAAVIKMWRWVNENKTSSG